MKIIVIGATGTIGSAVADALATRHEVLRASRTGVLPVDITNRRSLESFFDLIGAIDAVVCCAGAARFGPLERLTPDDYAVGLNSKLMGQVNVVRFGLERMRDGGSFTLTSGRLSRYPAPGGVAVSVAGAGVEAFVRAAQLELPRGIRLNAVSPGWVAETLTAMGKDPTPGMPAAEVARAYVAAVEGELRGQTLMTADYA
ncbi:MAG: short chain dehydrogenase [Deltaproteobacteria bacterium]|nr:MAG: short chain dehydrogenase [Deltaproteobacteria bacterium]